MMFWESQFSLPIFRLECLFLMLPEMEFHLGTLNYRYTNLGHISLSFSICLVVIFPELRKNRKFLLKWWLTSTSASYYLCLIWLPLNRQKNWGKIWNGDFIWKINRNLHGFYLYLCFLYCQSLFPCYTKQFMI